MIHPLTKIKSWVRSLFNRDNFKSIIGDTALTPEMQAAIISWMEAFYSRHSDRQRSNFPEVISGHIATLATNEISLSCGNGPRAEYIQAQLDRHVLSNIKQAVQLAAAGGLCALKPYVYNGEIYCDFVDALNFIPVRYAGSKINEALFLDSVTHGDDTFIKIERHSFDGGLYTITQKTYTGSGASIALSSVDEWAALSPITHIKGLECPLFAVLQTANTNTVDGSKAPVSMFSGALGTIKEIDELLSDISWERKSGKRKKILDATAVDFSQDTDGRIRSAYSPDEYILINPSGQTNKPFDDYTPDMRFDSYWKDIEMQLRIMESQIGLSSGTFQIDTATGGLKTATEIISEHKTTYNTIKAFQENGLRQGLEDIALVYDAYASLYDLAPSGSVEPSVDFGDSIFEDTATEFARRLQLVNMGALDKTQLIMWYFNVDEEKAAEMMGAAPPVLFGDNNA